MTRLACLFGLQILGIGTPPSPPTGHTGQTQSILIVRVPLPPGVSPEERSYVDRLATEYERAHVRAIVIDESELRRRTQESDRDSGERTKWQLAVDYASANRCDAVGGVSEISHWTPPKGGLGWKVDCWGLNLRTYNAIHAGRSILGQELSPFPIPLCLRANKWALEWPGASPWRLPTRRRDMDELWGCAWQDAIGLGELLGARIVHGRVEGMELGEELIRSGGRLGDTVEGLRDPDCPSVEMDRARKAFAGHEVFRLLVLRGSDHVPLLIPALSTDDGWCRVFLGRAALWETSASAQVRTDRMKWFRSLGPNSKLVILSFWRTGCSNSESLNACLSLLVKRYADWGLRWIAVNTAAQADQGRRNNLPGLRGATQVCDPSLAMELKITYVPWLALLDSQGKIVIPQVEPDLLGSMVGALVGAGAKAVPGRAE